MIFLKHDLFYGEHPLLHAFNTKIKLLEQMCYMESVDGLWHYAGIINPCHHYAGIHANCLIKLY